MKQEVWHEWSYKPMNLRTYEPMNLRIIYPKYLMVREHNLGLLKKTQASHLNY